ncbi:ATP-binding protein [Nocardioides sp.]|uniref:ATP-binding protein n=1 Tax=Nocardioides sp. TaxID=35761 RepID=UPI00351984DC
MTPPREPHVATEAIATSSDVPVVDPRTGVYDDATPWSGDAIFACAGEMAERMAAHPWDRNVLGPPAQWPPVLRTTVSMVLRSKYPMTLTWGEQFVMLYNDAYVPVLGEKHPDALGSPLAEQFPEIWDAIGPMQRAVLQGGEATWDENLPLVLERGDGPEECFFTFSYSPVPDGDQPGGVLAVLSMTTPEVLGARRLAILNDVGAVSASDPKTAAAAIAAALDRHPSELPGGRVWLSEGAAPVVAAAFGEPGPALEAPTPVVGPTILGAGRTAWRGLGGAHRPGHAVASPSEEQAADAGEDDTSAVLELRLPELRPLDEGHRRFLDQLSQAVAQRLEAARARELEAQRAAALSELNTAKTHFLSTMSHELRTPLTLLLGPLHDVLSGRVDVLDRAAVEQLNGQCQRLLGMVEDLLEISRSESGRLVAHPEAVDVDELTAQLVEPLLEAGERAGLRMSRTFRGAGTCLLDVRLWENVVLNLVSNAVKYTLEGSVHVDLAMDDRLVLTVRDTGIGIPEAQQPLVFQRFHRVRAGEGRSIEGAGVGLAIVADAVAELGGEVSLESAPGVGTTVTVRLPVREAEAAPAPATAPTALRLAGVRAKALDLVPVGEPGPERRPAAGSAGPTLLVVDDNVAMRQHVASALGEVGRVLVAADGVEALEVLARGDVDLVVSDVMMPRLDGEGLVAAIRESPDRPDVPVILLSARAGSEAAISGLGRGADDYVAKPFSREELVARVRAHLELSSLRRERQRRRDRETMLAGVSHDMQTPLATIANALELLTSLGIPDLPPEITGTMTRSVASLRGLVAEFLDWSALSTGAPVRVHLEDLEVPSLVADVAWPRGLELTTQVGAGAPVRADALRVRRILTNLATNAVGAGATRLWVGTDRDADGLHVRVRDDGPGIPAEVLARLFQPWATSQDTRGSGLGLYVSRESARAMGGDLTLVDTTSAGTTFDLRLTSGG